MKPIFIELGSPEWDEAVKVIQKTTLTELKKMNLLEESVWMSTGEAMELFKLSSRQAFKRLVARSRGQIKTANYSLTHTLYEKSSCIKYLNKLATENVG